MTVRRRGKRWKRTNGKSSGARRESPPTYFLPALTAPSSCKRCINADGICERSANPRKKSCKRCTVDKKTCSHADEPSPPAKARRPAASEFASKTQDVLEISEGHAVIKAVSSLGAGVERQSADMALLCATVDRTFAGLAGFLAEVKAELVEVKAELVEVKAELEDLKELARGGGSDTDSE